MKAANVEGSVSAASKDGKLYAFPMGGGNNYFLYYDSTKITAEQAQSWDGLLAAAEAVGSKVGMVYASGWYNASFFLGAGFITDMNPDGTTVMDWNGHLCRWFHRRGRSQGYGCHRRPPRLPGHC